VIGKDLSDPSNRVNEAMQRNRNTPEEGCDFIPVQGKEAKKGGPGVQQIGQKGTWGHV